MNDHFFHFSSREDFFANNYRRIVESRHGPTCCRDLGIKLAIYFASTNLHNRKKMKKMKAKDNGLEQNVVQGYTLANFANVFAFKKRLAKCMQSLKKVSKKCAEIGAGREFKKRFVFVMMECN